MDDTPADLSPAVARPAVRRMRFVAHVLDESVRIPGTSFRVGLDPILGLLPVVGDVASGCLSLYIVLESARLGVSNRTLVRMLANIALDVVAGSVPLVGDLFDAAWRANTRNVALALADLGLDGGD
ncbi:protein of unknown function [Haloplanus vescus]|uniref:DUF4112 domain-containing protein n=1 Tax=Haloplanus vescus TaxID=555874 RepID=A0A1H3WRE8_9EURY|nr:DUF4112 domain-containing protein [Haloplanus vescus]SDZ89321.1 protein of unknown function [Haloplanus vescus]